jgi:hypothetical protein
MTKDQFQWASFILFTFGPIILYFYINHQSGKKRTNGIQNIAFRLGCKFIPSISLPRASIKILMFMYNLIKHKKILTEDNIVDISKLDLNQDMLESISIKSEHLPYGSVITDPRRFSILSVQSIENYFNGQYGSLEFEFFDISFRNAKNINPLKQSLTQNSSCLAIRNRRLNLPWFEISLAVETPRPVSASHSHEDAQPSRLSIKIINQTDQKSDVVTKKSIEKLFNSRTVSAFERVFKQFPKITVSTGDDVIILLSHEEVIAPEKIELLIQSAYDLYNELSIIKNICP